MTTEILLALVASLFTASASVAQRLAAAPAPGELRFSWRLISFLLHRPVWFMGILCMIAGFLFQLAALDLGQLSLVQPIVATELLFVFAFLALRSRTQVHARDWLAALGMAAGLGAFLLLADPSGGSTLEATAWLWALAALAVTAAAAVAIGLAVAPRRGRQPSPARRAALLAVSAGVVWGFVAAVIKELSSHVSAGPYAVFTNWSPYVLVVSGAVAMFLVANAFQAGPLAASQPGLTIVDPLVASLIGITIFGEHLRGGGPRLVGEAMALVLLAASVVFLSRSPLVTDGAHGAGAPGAAEPPGVEFATYAALAEAGRIAERGADATDSLSDDPEDAHPHRGGRAGRSPRLAGIRSRAGES
jgi:drug/metabolite transporter (DMT)-like permease